MNLNVVLTVPVMGDTNLSVHMYHLRGLVYGGDFHFTSRIVDISGQVWYADGMTNQKNCIFERTVVATDDTEWLKSCQGQTLLYAIYENTNLHTRDGHLNEQNEL